MPNTGLDYQTDKSSHRRCYITKAVLKNFAIFTGKHLCWSLFFINFVKKSFQYKCFPIMKFLEHLRMAASELTLRSDWLELCIWTVAFKDIPTQ